MTDPAAAAREAAVTAWTRVSAIPVWVGAVVAAILIALLAREAYLVWMPITMAAAVIVSFAIQLGIQRKDGYVTRVMASVGGAFVILAVATGILALLP